MGNDNKSNDGSLSKVNCRVTRNITSRLVNFSGAVNNKSIIVYTLGIGCWDVYNSVRNSLEVA